MIIIARTIGARAVPTNTDRVVAAMPIPIGGKLLGVQGELHIISQAEDQPLLKFYAYGVTGELLPILSPDTAVEYQTIWDNVVVKASDLSSAAATSAIDFDWDTEDTAPTIEPGEVDVDDLMGMLQGQKTFIEPRLEWISWAKNRQGGFIAGSPDDWHPSDFKTFRSSRTLVAEKPSAALIAVSSPVLDDVRLEAAHLSPGASRWYMMQNMDDTMQTLGKFQVGLSELGALRPGSDASQIVEELIAQPMLDESTTLFENITWTCLMSCTWTIELPGNSIPNRLDGR